jgi:hypothetical protein
MHPTDPLTTTETLRNRHASRHIRMPMARIVRYYKYHTLETFKFCIS